MNSSTRPLRILYVIAMYGEAYLGNLIHRELGHELQQRGHTFEVFAFASARHGEPPGHSVEQGIAVERGVTAGTPLTDGLNALAKPFFRYDRFGAGWLALRRYLNRAPPYDVVIAEGAYPFGALCTLVPLRGARLIVTVAGGDFIDSRAARYGYGRFRIARALMRRAFRRAAAVRVTTPLVRERALALGAPPDRVVFVPRNIATYCYPPPDIALPAFRAASRQELQSQYEFGNAHLLVAVGRLLPIKGFDTLLRALPGIIQTAGPTHLLLAGPSRIDPQVGDYQAFLTKLAAELGVSANVTFTGSVPHREMRALLAGSDLVVVPSVLEGMNKIAVEGAAVGTPSVVTRTAGIADLIAKADCGLVIDRADPDALAAGIITLLCEPAHRAELAARGTQFAQQFTSPVVAEQLSALCQRILT